MALSMEVGLGPGYIVLDGDPAPPSKGAQQPPLFSPCLLWPRSPIPATDELLSKFEVRSFTPSEDRTEGPKIKKCHVTLTTPFRDALSSVGQDLLREHTYHI